MKTDVDNVRDVLEWLLVPFEVSFVRRALVAGVLVSLVCALVGTWVVLRGMAFLGEAVSHGLLPGVALASLTGQSVLLGAALSAGVMVAGVALVGRSRRVSRDTAIGLLFVGMLSVGVIIVSRSDSFAVDLTGFLFGDVLAVGPADLRQLAVAVAVAAAVSLLGHRAFLALAFDPRKARTLGLSPGVAHGVLLALVTLAIVASFRVVGALLVLGLLIAPPAAALLWAHRVPMIMLGAAALGCASTVVGLVASWHAGTAAGATIAAVAVALFFVSALAAHLRGRRSVGAAVAHPEEVRA
jgi:ABC-type Mn2+/Zn2+ transport system permease subunit